MHIHTYKCNRKREKNLYVNAGIGMKAAFMNAASDFIPPPTGKDAPLTPPPRDKTRQKVPLISGGFLDQARKKK